MDKACEGKNCTTTTGIGHSVECLFDHFMAYTQYLQEDAATQTKLRKAYFDGYEAGVGDWIPVENQLPDECSLVIVRVDRYGYYPNYLSTSTRQNGRWTKEEGNWQRISHWKPMPLMLA